MQEKSKRGGYRENAGRPFLNEEKGRRYTHGITLYDEMWDQMVLDTARMNISVSQLIEKAYQYYKKEENKIQSIVKEGDPDRLPYPSYQLPESEEEEKIRKLLRYQSSTRRNSVYGHNNLSKDPDYRKKMLKKKI